MSYQLSQLIIDKNKVDITDIRECWEWLIKDMKEVLLISKTGDLFLIGKDSGIYWLATDSGELKRVARDLEDFKALLKDYSNIDEWFLPGLIEDLEGTNILLADNEVYSYTLLPVMGGEYSISNIEPTDISVHFAITGQIHEQIKDLPAGTKVQIKPID